jgi:hypothetical protein
MVKQRFRQAKFAFGDSIYDTAPAVFKNIARNKSVKNLIDLAILI